MMNDNIVRMIRSRFMTRRIGNTTLEKMGVDNYDSPFIFVGIDYKHAKELCRDNPNAIPASIYTLSETMKGNTYPIIVDHTVMAEILYYSFNRQKANDRFNF